MTDQVDQPYNLQPFRRAVLRGFGVILPPLLTVVILLWIGNSIQNFVLTPVEWASRQCIVGYYQWHYQQSKSAEIEAAAAKAAAEADADAAKEDRAVNGAPTAERAELRRLAMAIERIERQLLPTVSATRQQPSNDLRPQDRRFSYNDNVYVKLPSGQWVPAFIVDQVRQHLAETGVPLENTSARGYYDYYVAHRILRKGVVIPLFFAGFILLMYLLGKFLAAGVGRILWNSTESIIVRLPIIRTVYNSVKQVTDFFVGESDIDFQRVVAVEYPRKGIWSVGFVTGESLLTIRGAAAEEVISVLMPTSPVPGTGFTVTVRKSETIELDIPIDQALQFVVSCGVVVPGDETARQQLREEVESRIATGLLESGTGV